MIKFFIRYLEKRGFVVLHKSDTGATVFFDSEGNKWSAWKR